jgi:hypothetical protein
MSEAKQLFTALQQQKVLLSVDNADSLRHIEGLVKNIGKHFFMIYLVTPEGSKIQFSKKCSKLADFLYLGGFSTYETQCQS